MEGPCLPQEAQVGGVRAVDGVFPVGSEQGFALEVVEILHARGAEKPHLR